jgi:hypothetical protein
LPTRPSSSPSYMTAPPLRSQLPSSHAKTGDDEASPSFKEVYYRAVNRHVGGSCMSLAASRVSLTHMPLHSLFYFNTRSTVFDELYIAERHSRDSSS